MTWRRILLILLVILVGLAIYKAVVNKTRSSAEERAGYEQGEMVGRASSTTSLTDSAVLSEIGGGGISAAWLRKQSALGKGVLAPDTSRVGRKLITGSDDDGHGFLPNL